MSNQFPGMDINDPAIQAELQRISEKPVYDNSDRKQIFYYNFVEGDNNLFFLPRFSFKNPFPFKKVYKYFKLPIQDKYSHMCIEKTYPELGVRCPIHDALLDLRAAGHNVDQWWPALHIHWQVVKFEPGIVNYVTKKDGKDVTIQFEGSETPQLIRLTTRLHDELFSYLTNPAIGDFTNPLNAIPMRIKYSKANNKTTYSLSWVGRSENRIMVPDRQPIWVNPDGTPDTAKIESIIGKWEQQPDQTWKLNNSQLYELDRIFAAPLNELKAPDGNIYKASVQLRQHFGMLDQSAHVQMAPPAPGLPPTQQYGPPVTQYQQPAAAPPVYNPTVQQPPVYQQPQQQYQQPAQQQVPPSTLQPQVQTPPSTLPPVQSPPVQAPPVQTPPPAPNPPKTMIPPGLTPPPPPTPPKPLPPIPDGASSFQDQGSFQEVTEPAPPAANPKEGGANRPRSMNTPEGMGQDAPRGIPKIPGSPASFGTYWTTSKMAGNKCHTCAFAVICKSSSPQPE